MANVTYFVALPFGLDDAGNLVPGQAEETQQPSSAIRRAEGMVRTGAAGAVAFSRTGDPNIGEFEPATILQTFGLVPDDLSEL
ncbi:MAG: hypothetical protein AB7O60_03670 [Variibacter sp.]